MEREISKTLELSETVRIGTTSSSPFTGSPTFDLVPFHVDVDREPALGTYVVIERDEEDILHYGRIVSGSEENSRADPSRLQQNQAYQVGQKNPRPGDRSPFVTRVMNVEVLGEIHLDDAEVDICELSVLAQTGKSVYEIPANRIPWLLGIPDEREKGLFLGEIVSGGKKTDFILPMEAIARHLAIAGKTGVGKSYATGVIIEEITNKGIPVLAFDVLGDLIHATQDLKGKNYQAGIDFKVPYSIIGLSEFLNFIPNLTREQSELVAMAYDVVFGEALQMLEDSGTIDIPYNRLFNEIISVAANFGQAAVGQRAKTRVEAAVRRNNVLTEQTDNWLRDLREAPILNIFIGRLGQNMRNLIVGSTARMLQLLRRRNQVPPFEFVLDEAHLFLPAGGETTASTAVIRELVRTARHDAIGIVLVTQSPSSMDKQVLLTCNTRLVFALDQEDIRLVSGTMGDLAEETIARIPKLAKGTAIISSGMDIMRHPALIRIRTRATREGAPTPNLAEEVKKWRAQRNS